MSLEDDLRAQQRAAKDAPPRRPAPVEGLEWIDQSTKESSSVNQAVPLRPISEQEEELLSQQLQDLQSKISSELGALRTALRERRRPDKSRWVRLLREFSKEYRAIRDQFSLKQQFQRVQSRNQEAVNRRLTDIAYFLDVFLHLVRPVDLACY